MRRRSFLQTAALATAGLAGCGDDVTPTPENESVEFPPETGRTTGVDPCEAVEAMPAASYRVDPWAVERTDDGDWRLDCDVTVRFDYGSRDVGFEDAVLVAAGPDGRLLAGTPATDLGWTDAPASGRRTDDCGSPHRHLRRRVSLTAPRLPERVGLDFAAAPATVVRRVTHARYDDERPPDAPVDPAAYAETSRDRRFDWDWLPDTEGVTVSHLGLAVGRAATETKGYDLQRDTDDGQSLVRIGWRWPDPSCDGPLVTGVDYDADDEAIVVGLRRRAPDADCTETSLGVRLSLQVRHDSPPARYRLAFADGETVTLGADEGGD